MRKKVNKTNIYAYLSRDVHSSLLMLSKIILLEQTILTLWK